MRPYSLCLARDSRHTTACHLVFAGADINTVRAWLGHASIDTTNVYAEINLKMKAEAMALCHIPGLDPDRHWNEDKDLMAFLNAY
ncbi:MAG: tyrosine-type recombinase/integrase [Rhodospirillales bacterium]|nr:tyrosine-type recombinase/integrase [Rhodospirillales bacterium]